MRCVSLQKVLFTTPKCQRSTILQLVIMMMFSERVASFLLCGHDIFGSHRGFEQSGRVALSRIWLQSSIEGQYSKGIGETTSKVRNADLSPETFYSIRAQGKDPSHMDSQWVVEVRREEGDRLERSATSSCRSYFVHGADFVRVQTTDPTETGLGHTVWNSGIALAALMTDRCSGMSEDLNGKKVLELGAGPALTGLSIAKAFPDAEVHLTDYNPSIVENLREVAVANNLSNVQTWELDWNSFLEPGWSLPGRPHFDLVVAADCVYHRMPSAFTAAVLHLSEENTALRFLMMSQADRVGLPLVVDRLHEIDTRPVATTAFTFSQYDTALNLNKFPVALRRKAKDIPLVCLEIARDAKPKSRSASK